MTQSIITQFLSGFSVVAILIIAALGLAIIFGVAGVINMAHGEFIMVGAYTAAVVGKLGGNTLVAIPVAFVTVGLLGLLIERGIVQWIYDRPLETLLATWGVGIILQTVTKLIFGPELYYVGSPKFLAGGFRVIGRLPFPWYRLFLVIVAILLLALVFHVIFKTNLGLEVRAVRRNRAIAGCLGIDTARVDMAVFVFGSGLAGIAGAVLAPIKSVSTAMGFPYAVDSFMVLVLGGVGNLWGVAAGAGLIGEAETVLSFIFNNVIGRLLVFLFIVVTIRLVPKGIFGYYERR
ncbi:MAG: urea ABC transporter permease subunit UrtB [Deltaproteobacteria bacterium]|jgi:urea transport system permease protein|nr:urea ABC transporter permease subunit UrtB [Deltaproteobacteria bacterium]